MPNPKPEIKQIDKKGLIEEQRQSGLSAKQWCLQNKISPSTFCSWKKALCKKELQRSSFTEIACKQISPILLQTRGISIRISQDCDSTLRRKFFHLLAEELC